MVDELDELRRTVRELVGSWEFAPGCDAWMRGLDPAFTRELARRGLIGITWPAPFGAGRSNLARLVVTEELLRAGAPVGAHWIADRQIGPAVLRNGSAALRAELLPGIAAGEVTFCLGMSETEAGSDLASVRTRAVRDGGGWRVTGRKIWTTGAHHATHAYVLARTGGGADKHDGLTEFVVEMSAPGVSVRPIEDLGGEHHFNEVVFDEVFVPGGRVIGAEGEGWKQVTEQLSFERGGMERVLSTYPLLAALADRELDPEGRPALGTLAARLLTLRELACRVAEAMDAGRAPAGEAAVLKYLGTTFEREVVDVARTATEELPALDGDGFAGLLAQAQLAAPGFSIRGGTDEMLLTVVSRQAPPPEVDEIGRMADDVLTSAADPWATAVELGWTAVGVPEEKGGSGGTFADLAGLVRAAGRHAHALPLAEVAVARMLSAQSAGSAEFAGRAGSAGLAGSAEFASPAGSAGLAGSARSVGSAGPAGSVPAESAGSVGSAGLVGSAGPARSAGLAESAEFAGLAGSAGSVGSAGPAESLGLAGSAGPAGSVPAESAGSAAFAESAGSAVVAVAEDLVVAGGRVSASADVVSLPEHGAVLLVGRDVVACVAASAVTGRAWRGLAGQARTRIHCVDVPADILPLPDGTDPAAWLAVLRVHTALGAVEGTCRLTRAHVTSREQFGRPLARLQAVAHRLAEMECARVLLEVAASAALSLEPARVAAAATLVDPVATTVARLAHQLHGAMGITRESPLHRYTTLLWSVRDETGPARRWARRLHDLVPSEESLWRTVTTRPGTHT